MPITSATRANATQAGIPATSNCWSPTDPNVGMNGAQAKQYLNSIWCRGKAARCGAYTSNVEQLDPGFAVCIASFLQKIKRVDPTLCMSSAYRSTGHQQCICGPVGRPGCLGAGKSKHQRGIAVDVNFPGHPVTSPKYQWLHAEIRKFGGIRHLTLRGDPYHIDATGGRCATAGYQPSDPSQYSAAPSAPVTSALRDLFNPPPQQQQQPSPQLPQQPQQPQQQTPQIPPGYCIKSLNPLEIIPCPQQQQPGSASPMGQNVVDAFGQPTGQGGQGTVSSQITLPTSTTPGEEEKKSAVEQISDWIFGAGEAAPEETDVPIDLILSGEDTAALEDDSSLFYSEEPSSNPASHGGVYAEQTFTSPGLANPAAEAKPELNAYQGSL